MTIDASLRPQWPHLDTVLLDLDGTLLDLAYDNWFWLKRIPEVYAAARSLSLREAERALEPQFRACEGTLNWYCIDYWSRELGLNVAALKRADVGRIRWIPGAEGFLRELRARGKRLVLVTNCHPEVLRIKDECTGVTKYMDAVYSSHTFGAAKEDQRFWKGVRALEPFDVEHTIFVDDSLRVLRAAREAGLKHIYAVRRPDSSTGPRHHDEFPAVDAVSELL
jgi:putative hydrolase of the HAD superfamily